MISQHPYSLTMFSKIHLVLNLIGVLNVFKLLLFLLPCYRSIDQLALRNAIFFRKVLPALVLVDMW